MKTCKRCGHEKSISEFAIFKNKLPSGKISEGVRGICKECQNSTHKRTYIRAACPTCGIEHSVRADTLNNTNGLCQSCATSARIARDGHFAQIRNGKRLSEEPSYRRLQYMKARCNGSTSTWKRRYKDRGISVCQEWIDDPWSFVDWAIENGFAEHLTIDRIDNSSGYSPENCRWVDMKTQARNTENNRSVTFSDGRTFSSLAEAAEALGTSQDRVYKALSRGWRCMGYEVSYSDFHSPQLTSSK